jgi:hypothetical protein
MGRDTAMMNSSDSISFSAFHILGIHPNSADDHRALESLRGAKVLILVDASVTFTRVPHGNSFAASQ